MVRGSARRRSYSTWTRSWPPARWRWTSCYGATATPPPTIESRVLPPASPLEERQPSAYEIAQALWCNIAVTQAFLTLSEVLGHLDRLEADGSVREFARDGVNVCELT
jgi:hypothetical protein